MSLGSSGKNKKYGTEDRILPGGAKSWRVFRNAWSLDFPSKTVKRPLWDLKRLERWLARA